LPTASPYLKVVLTRWTDRQSAVRKELEQAKDHVAEKRLYLDDLMNQILRHRQEDMTHLSIARQASDTQWQERLARLETWNTATQSLATRFERVEGWHKSAQWFERAMELAETLKQRLLQRASRYEIRHAALQESLESWLGRLTMKEIELHQFKQHEAALSGDIFVSSARKQPFVDFALAERQEESRLNRDLRLLREAANLYLNRLEEASSWAQQRADYHPVSFEHCKNQIQDTTRDTRERYAALRNRIMNSALLFEEGRKRLRWIYDTVQLMRVVPTLNKAKRSFWDRLLNYESE